MDCIINVIFIKRSVECVSFSGLMSSNFYGPRTTIFVTRTLCVLRNAYISLYYLSCIIRLFKWVFFFFFFNNSFILLYVRSYRPGGVREIPLSDFNRLPRNSRPEDIRPVIKKYRKNNAIIKYKIRTSITKYNRIFNAIVPAYKTQRYYIYCLNLIVICFIFITRRTNFHSEKWIMT